MLRSLYTAVSGLITNESRQDVITNNIANANTVGYKEDNLSIKKFDDVLIKSYDSVLGGDPNSPNTKRTIGNLSLGASIDETKTNFTQGDFMDTGKTTDFAIEGSGFFVVQRDNGKEPVKNYYTRDGHFHVNYEGNLVNDSGDYVLNSTGNKIYVGKEEIKSRENGELTIGGNTSKLDIVDFNDYDSLKKSGDNLYTVEGDATPTSAQKFSVLQKNLEKSNVNVINAMVDMMTVMRSFETNQKILQSIDETLEKAVNEVGSVR